MWEKRQSYYRKYGKRDKVITGDMGISPVITLSLFPYLLL
jgi:hypothetical protein